MNLRSIYDYPDNFDIINEAGHHYLTHPDLLLNIKFHVNT